MDFLQHYTIRPAVGSLRVEVTCSRCKGLVRDQGMSGVANLAAVVAAAEGHEKRMHRPKVVPQLVSA